MVKYWSSVLKTVVFELKDASLNELLKAGLFGKKDASPWVRARCV